MSDLTRISNIAVGLVRAGELEPEEALLAVVNFRDDIEFSDFRPEFGPSWQNAATCANGHTWTADTIYRRKNGQRVCRQCSRDYKHKHRLIRAVRNR